MNSNDSLIALIEAEKDKITTHKSIADTCTVRAAIAMADGIIEIIRQHNAAQGNTKDYCKRCLFGAASEFMHTCKGDASTRKDEEKDVPPASPIISSEISVVERLESLKTGIDAPYQEGWDHGLSEAIKCISSMKPVSVSPKQIEALIDDMAEYTIGEWDMEKGEAQVGISNSDKIAKAVLDAAGVPYVN